AAGGPADEGDVVVGGRQGAPGDGVTADPARRRGGGGQRAGQDRRRLPVDEPARRIRQGRHRRPVRLRLGVRRHGQRHRGNREGSRGGGAGGKRRVALLTGGGGGRA